MKNVLILLLTFLLFIFCSIAGEAAILSVPAGYSTIQSAILASANGDTVLVSRGTYFENINFRGKNIDVASRFILTNDPADIDNTLIDGSSPAFADTASCVLFISGEDSTAVLQGFTLLNGTGTNWIDEHGAGTFVEGGGILIQYSSPTIKNNRILNNEAVRLLGNTRSAGGGGIRAGDSNPHILNNYIWGNRGMYGGGIVLNYSGAVIKNNVIIYNSVYQADPTAPTFGGGGIWAVGESPSVKIIENNTIVGNSSTGTGSGFAGRGGAIIISATLDFRNNIAWGNTQTTGNQVAYGVSFAGIIEYNDIQDNTLPPTNFNSDPVFSDDLFHLDESSPCIDAGKPDSIYNDPADVQSPSIAQSYSKGSLLNDMGAFGGPGRTPETFTISFGELSHGMIVLSGGTQVQLPSLNVEAGSNPTFLILPDPGYIIKYVRVNGNGVGAPSSYTFSNIRDTKSITAGFERAYTIISSSGAHGSISPSGSITVLEGYDTTFTISSEHGYVIDSLFVDGALIGTEPFYSFTNVSADHSIAVSFRFDSSYLNLYRTFRPDSIAFDKDNLGKMGKLVKKKATSVDFKFQMTAPATAVLALKFSMKTSGALTRGTEKTDTVMSWINQASVVSPVAMDSGSIFQVDGVGASGKTIKVTYQWATSPKAKGTVADSTYVYNTPRLPMPNRVNVLAEIFTRGGFPTGLNVGIARPDSAKRYGWVLCKKSDDVLKSLYDKKSGVHDGQARNFDLFSNNKPFIGLLKTLPPSKHDNHLFGNLLALKVSIAASALNITPFGFGELIYDDGLDSRLNGKTVKGIAALADSMLSARTYSATLGSTSYYNSQYGYSEIDSAINRILTAFEGPLDTSDGGFSGLLALRGAQSLLSVPFLQANHDTSLSGLIDNHEADFNLPAGFLLGQNYPNPFNPATTISFEIAKPAIVTLKIYNILGQEVATLFEKKALDAGVQEVLFEASGFSSGVYFYRLTAESFNDEGAQKTFSDIKKMVLMR